MSIFGEPTPRQRLEWRLADQIRRLAVEEFDAVAVQIPIGDTGIDRPGLSDPLAGVRAVVLVRGAAVRAVRDYVREAREAGRSWDHIGEALGVDDDEDRTRAERAFDEVAGHVDSFGGRRMWWRCPACGAGVTDRGPYASSHPDDIEAGHAETCTRHAAGIAAWRARTGWEDEL